MATKKITDLQLRDNVSDDVNIPGDDGIQTYRVTAAQIKEYILAPLAISKSMLATALQDLLTPVGAMSDFAGAAAPNGWLLCFGQAVSRTTYADLFALVGTTYGSGDGSTTFNLPDLRGRVAVGKDDMGGSAASRMTTGGSGVDGATLGAVGGSQTHQLTTAQMPSHTHTQNSHTHSIPAADNNGGNTGMFRFTNMGPIDVTWDTNSTTATNQNTGGDGVHNNTQPSIILNKIIKF